MEYTLHLSEDEVKEWTDAFRIFDSENHGFISRADLYTVCSGSVGAPNLISILGDESDWTESN
jgi:Ca2+-binding EF-hand superfamily protein